MGGGGEAERQAKIESEVPASATAATCACVRESEHWNQNHTERQQLDEPREEDGDQPWQLHGVPDEIVREGQHHLEWQAGGALVKDSVPERKAFPWLLKMKSR